MISSSRLVDHGARAVRYLAILMLLAALAIEPAAPGRAAGPIVVTTAADSLAVDGTCSLREAIIAVNTQSAVDTCDGKGNTVISLPAGAYVLSLQAPRPAEDTSGIFDLDISHDMTIVGAGEQATIVDANKLDRVLEVVSGVVALSDLTLQGGDGQFGGAIRNRGTMSIRNVILTHNFASADGGAVENDGVMHLDSASVTANSSLVFGGAFANHGALQLVNSIVWGNFVSDGDGGGFWNKGELRLLNTQVIRNSSDGDGGGIVNSNGIVEITNSIIASNDALINDIDSTGGVGGISSTGTLTMTGSTVSDNSGEHTGGIFNSGKMTLVGSTVSGNAGRQAGGGLTNSGALSLVNSTISGNRANGDGGGIQNRGGLSLSSVTIANNLADGDGDGAGGGGGVAAVAGTVAVTNTVLAGNRAALGQASDCAGTLVSYGYNAPVSASGCVLAGSSAGNQIGAEPGLAPLAANGGATLTHALLRGSPLIDAGDPTACPASDQRGVARPADGDHDGAAACDIGAYEADAILRVYLPLGAM